MSKIVRYTGEQIKSLPSETNWQRPIPTDEEIDAANALDPEVEGIDDAWMERAILTQANQKLG